MRLSKKLAAAVMSIGLMAAGITGVTSLNDATTPSAEAASSCRVSVYTQSGLAGKTGYALNRTCAYAQYWQVDSANGKRVRHFGNYASTGQRSSLGLCYGKFVSNGANGWLWSQVRFA